MNLKPVTFNYINDKIKHTRYGLIAEDVEKVIKDLVAYDIDEKGNESVYSVKYNDLIPLLLHELQLQRKIINKIELDNKNEISKIKAAFEKLNKKMYDKANK